LRFDFDRDFDSDFDGADVGFRGASPTDEGAGYFEAITGNGLRALTFDNGNGNGNGKGNGSDDGNGNDDGARSGLWLAAWVRRIYPAPGQG
jgi:hypothetical protein